MPISGLEDLEGLPSVQTTPEGLLVLSWPAGRPEEVELAVDLFEALLGQVNSGRKAWAVIGVITSALSALVSSATDNRDGAPERNADTP